MKRILFIRHGTQDSTADALTHEAREQAKALRQQLPHFDLVASSPAGRAMETAELLTGTKPIPDIRLRFPASAIGIGEEIKERRKNHPFGAAGAIFDTPAARKPFREHAELLLEFCKQTFKDLPPDGTALFASHDGLMVALDKVILNQSFEGTDHTYIQMQGFWLQEDLSMTRFPS